MAAPLLVALMAENAPSERPGPHPNGTILIVRSTRRMFYWNGAWTTVLW